MTILEALIHFSKYANSFVSECFATADRGGEGDGQYMRIQQGILAVLLDDSVLIQRRGSNFALKVDSQQGDNLLALLKVIPAEQEHRAVRVMRDPAVRWQFAFRRLLHGLCSSR